MNVRLLLPLAPIAAAWCGSVVADETRTVLVYQVAQPEGAHAAVSTTEMHSLVAAVGRRLKAGHAQGALVRMRDDKSIEVSIPSTDPNTVQRVARLVESPGTLEFRILANRHDHTALIDRAEKAGGSTVKDEKGRRLAWWVPVVAAAQADLEKDNNIATRKRKEKGQQVLEVLVVQDPFNVTGRYLKSASAGVDSRGKPCVEFTLDDKGSKLFVGLTGNNLPDAKTGFGRRLGIVLDGRLRSAPRIQSTISAHGEITGNFTEQEVKDLVAVLQAGSMPVRIKQVGKSTVTLKR
jgi:SecD/SecF fusion protein